MVFLGIVFLKGHLTSRKPPAPAAIFSWSFFLNIWITDSRNHFCIVSPSVCWLISFVALIWNFESCSGPGIVLYTVAHAANYGRNKLLCGTVVRSLWAVYLCCSYQSSNNLCRSLLFVSSADQFSTAHTRYKTMPGICMNFHKLLYMEIQYLIGCDVTWKHAIAGGASDEII